MSIKIQAEKCILEKLLAPIYGFFNEFYTNKGLIIDYINEESIVINTPHKELYGIKLEGKSNHQEYFTPDDLSEIYRNFNTNPKAYFFYVILKEGIYHSQYIFSFSRDILKSIASKYELQLMSGNDIANSIIDLWLQNDYYVKNKQINRTLSLNFNEKYLESTYLQFNKLAKENIYSNLVKTDLYQSYKMLDVTKSDIQQLFTLNFKGAIWFYFDFYEQHINNQLNLLISTARIHGNIEHFKKLKDEFLQGELELFLCNSTIHLKEFNTEILGALNTCVKTAYLKKNINKLETLRKTPLKYRDTEFDFLADKSYVGNLIANVHKRKVENPDIWGYDKNKGFINYSFADENSNPHSVWIADSGAGKSFQKQKAISQIVKMDINTAKADFSMRKIRSYDIGYSDEDFISFLENNKENNIVRISSELKDFSYNLCSLDYTDLETFEDDLKFQTGLISLILQTKNSEILELKEESLFQEVLKNVYNNNLFQDYRVRDIENMKLSQELLSKGYDKNTKLKDLEDYDYLKKPLLRDVIVFCNEQSYNRQLKEEEAENYKSLTLKLESIDKLKIFSKFDVADTVEANFLAMDLNNFKEIDLFPAIFLCIFQKVYLKDRKADIYKRRNELPRPKTYIFLEEVKNYFRVPYFLSVFEKILLEARKYNISIHLFAQKCHHLPAEIIDIADTRIFLTKSSRRLELLKDIKKYYTPDEKIITQFMQTETYEMFIWYSEGEIHIKFDINDKEYELFNTTYKEELENKVKKK